METLLAVVLIWIGGCGVACTWIASRAWVAADERRQRELNYREELRNMRCGTGLSQRQPEGGSGMFGELEPIIGLLSDPSVQTILKQVLAAQQQKVPENGTQTL